MAEPEYAFDVYSVGDDELCLEGFEDGMDPKPVWVVYDYEEGCYCGNGDLVYFDGTNLWSHGLSHCSCYGPLDELDAFQQVDVFDLFSPDLHACDIMDTVQNKVRELLQQDPPST